MFKKNETHQETISARDVVEEFNIPYHTLNYYAVIGLLPVLKKKGNVRLFDRQVIRERLGKISVMIAEGYPLQLIRKKLSEETD